MAMGQRQDSPDCGGSLSRWLHDPWVLLAVGAVLLLFSYGVDNLPLAAWLSPVFLLRFARTRTWRIWVPALLVVQIGAAAFQFRGMFLASGMDYWVSLLLGSAPALLPFVADRALVRRTGLMGALLAFPLAWTLLDYLNSFGPYGSWGAAAYSQFGQLDLLQLISVTGLWGITFLIGAFATVCNLLWESGWASRPVRLAVFGFSATLALILLAGSLRLAAFRPDAPVVRIASLASRDFSSYPPQKTWGRLVDGQANAGDLALIRAWAKTVDDDLLMRADAAAQAGAKVVFWSEGNAQVLKADEPALLNAGSQLAAKDHIYLGMGDAVWTPGQAKPLENELVMIRPDGQIDWQYHKSHPVPGDEASLISASDGQLRSIDTPYGRLAGAICFDADFIQTMSQTGAMQADILLNPSNDWAAIDPWHTEMASFRALEQGVNVIHQASHGLSAAYDYEGNQLAALDYFQSDDPTMVTAVPTRGARTFYSRWGDWFAWLSCAVFLVSIIQASFAKYRGR